MLGFGDKSLDVERNIVAVQLFTKGEGGPLRHFWWPTGTQLGVHLSQVSY